MWTQGATGQYAASLGFDGTDDYADAASYTPTTGLSTITAEAWINTSTINPAGGEGRIINRGTNDILFQVITGGKLNVYINNGGNIQTTSQVITTNTWYHVAFTWTTPGTVTIYVNGVAKSTTGTLSTTTINDSGSSNLRIGAYTNGATTSNFTGQIDDIKLYNTARTAAQIASDYSQTYTIATTAVGTSVPSTSFATEEKAPSPVAYWKFDDATGTNAQDSTTNNNDGTISGATWQTEDLCISGKCLSFDGTNDVVTVSNTVSGIQTVSFWIKPITTSEQIIDINGTASISVSSGTISATSFTSPTIYVNGVVSSTLVANTWQYVTVTTNTALSGSAIKIGQISTNYGQAFIDDVKIYPYTRTAAQVATDFASRGSVKGSSTALGGNNETMKQLSNGLVGYWKMDESSGNATDSSGNGYTGTATGTTIVGGKFGNSRDFAGGTDKLQTSNAILSGTGDFTISAWVNRDSASSYDAFAGNYGTGSCVDGIQLSGLNTGKLQLYVGAAVIGSTTLSASTWYHVVGVRSSGSIKLYVNGVEDGSGTLAASIGANCNWAIGNGPNYTSESHEGLIDEQRVYNRALSPAEVTTLYTFAPGPVGYWKMDENTGTSANDTSGNANTGTWNGTLGSQWKPGKYGTGGSFDGSTNFVQVADSSNLQVANAITLESWVKFNSAPSGLRNVVTKETATAGYVLLFNSSTLTFSFYNGTAFQDLNYAGTWTPGQWYHIVGTYDPNGGSNNEKIFVNGVQVAQQTVTGNISTSNQVLTIGYRALLTDRYFNGLIDEAKIYNYARTAKQIVEDMNAGHPAPGSPVGSAVGHWKFDEGYGTTANNSGSQGQTLQGSLSGMSSPATATSGWTQSGKFGKGLIFDGSNDYIIIPDTTSSALDVTSGVTLSSWIYPTANTGSDAGIIYKTLTTYAMTHHTDGKVYMYINAGSQNCNFAVTLNTWTHVAGTYDGSTIKCYQNGNLVSSTSLTATISTDNNSIYIGSSGTTYFPGTIDEPKIYNYALTADQVKLDMNRSQAQVMGALSDTNSLNTSQPQAAASEYCVPGDTTSTSCAAPVGRWDFEEGTGSTVNDTSGNANTGTWNGTLGSQWKPGKVGGGGNFNGSDDYVQTNYSLPTTDLTISLWINEASGNTDGNGRAFGYENAASGTHGLGLYYPTATNPTIIMRNNGTTYDMSWGTITVGSWNHYVATISSTAGTKLYLNGIQTNSNASATAFTSAGVTLRIGSAGASSPYFFKGQIDQVRIFNYARSAAQVAWDYNRGAPVGHWKFDECQGTQAYDSSGNGNTGTITVGASGTQTAVGTCTGSANTMWKDGATGKYNSSLDFDGTDDYVSITTPSSLQSLTDISISAWVYSSNFSHNGMIVEKDNVNTQWELFVESSASNEGSAGVKWRGGSATGIVASFPSNSNWHHIVATQTGTTAKIYIDGIQTASGTAAALGTGSGNINIGRYASDGAGYYFTGQIDDVRIYNYALTPVQVKSLYTGGAVRFGPVTGAP